MAANHKILITESLERSLDKDNSLCNRSGFDFVVAKDGRQILAALETDRPDMVFMDLYLPDMGGDECCHAIKSDSHLGSVPVVLAVKREPKDDLLKCQKAHCDDIIFKPVSDHLILSTAQRILGVSYRNSPRVKMRLPVRHWVYQGGCRTDFSTNLSAGGVFIETMDPYMPDEKLSLELVLPATEREIRCQACVAWVNTPKNREETELPPGMGLQFLSLNLPDLLAIREHVSRAGSGVAS